MKPFIWRFLGIGAALALLLAGGLALWQAVSPPTAVSGELRVLDEQPVVLPFVQATPETAVLTETVTLLTIIDPLPTAELALPPALADGLTVEAAVAVARETQPQQTVTEINLNQEAGVLIYEIALSDRTKLSIDARSGQVLEIDAAGQDNRPRMPLAQGVAPGVSMSAAIATALARFPGAALVEAELEEEEDGLLVYDILLDNETAVYINATTGEIVEVEQEG
ncbi:MAG: PepSY domain-containing protein [Chloroflexota bacterium]